ncbi:MAG TPA: hypothetical protein DCR55_13640 [Lentisphaeria bacterium]|nr:hypothetical protein [Lentisphaeria bacterium]
MNTHRSVLILSISLAVTVTITVLIAIGAPRTNVYAAVSYGPRPTMSINPAEFEAQLEMPPPVIEMNVGTLVKGLTDRAYGEWRAGNVLEAEELFRNVLLWEVRPGPMQAVGQLAFVDHRYHEAVNFFTHFKKIAPERIEAYTNLSAALMCLHRYDEAQKVIDEGYAKLGGTFSGPFDFMQACIHFHRGELEESDAILAKAQSSLGPEIQLLVNTHWSRGLRALPSYNAGLPADSGETPPAK